LFAIVKEEKDEDHDQETGGHEFHGRRGVLVSIRHVLLLGNDAHLGVDSLDLVRGIGNALQRPLDDGQRPAGGTAQKTEFLFDVSAARGDGDLAGQ